MVTNSYIGLNNSSGLSADGAGITVRVGDSTIYGNAFALGSGVAVFNAASVRTYGDNRLDGNGTDGTFTAPVLPEK